MRDYPVKLGPMWVRATVDGSWVRVHYVPLLSREQMSIRVLDYQGQTIDVYDLSSGHPPHQELLVWEMEVDEPEEVAQWIAAHLQSGIATLSEVGELIDEDGALMVMDGGRYTIDGVDGRVSLLPNPHMFTFEGEEIDLSEEDIGKLVPFGASVSYMDIEQP